MAELPTLVMQQPSTKLLELILGWIEELPSSEHSNWLNKECKEEQMLPLHATTIYLWTLKLDGQVYCMDHEAFGHPLELEHDPLTRYAVLFQGAQTYPALMELLPPIPDGVHVCTSCAGKGWVESQSSYPDSCFSCYGLGWAK
jgi:hypothetical protein